MTISRGNKIILKGHKQNNDIYILDMKVNSLRIDAGIQVNAAEVQARLWHERLGHVSLKTIRCMIRKNRIDGIQLNGNMFPDYDCKACKLGKAHRIPYKNIYQQRLSYKVGEFFHSDLCGPMQVTSLGGARYFLTFIDDASSYRNIYTIKHKSDVYECFQKFERMVSNKFRANMKVLRSDRGREYVCNLMKQYME